MKHYTIWDWSDFVRGVGEDNARADMQAHLLSGCSRCEWIAITSPVTFDQSNAAPSPSRVTVTLPAATSGGGGSTDCERK